MKHSVTQTETTEAEKQKSNFLCMTAAEPGVEDTVEDKLHPLVVSQIKQVHLKKEKKIHSEDTDKITLHLR